MDTEGDDMVIVGNELLPRPRLFGSYCLDYLPADPKRGSLLFHLTLAMVRFPH